MNLFGVGPLELAVILIVALVFVGPDRLPRLAADLARTIREIRKYTSGLAAEFNEVIKDVEKETEGERGVWKEVAEGIGGATQQVTEAMRGVRQDIFKPEAKPDAKPDAKPEAKPDAPAATNSASPPANGATAPAAATPSAGWIDIPDPDEAPAIPADPEHAGEPAEAAS